MSVLQNFPMVSQETPVTGDNKPSENKLYDCVAASIDAACRYLLNKPENSVFNPDHFKDIAYNDTYIGGTAAIKYIDFCKLLGVHLYAVQGASQKLVALAHGYLAQSKPVIFTEPDPYSSDPNMTHVCCFYADGPGYLIAMDPFPLPGMANVGHGVRYTDAEWTNLLRFGEIWITERMDDMPQPLSIDMPAVAALFEPIDAHHWRSRKTGKILQFALLASYCKNGQASLDYLEDVVSNEIPVGPNRVIQFHKKGVRMWNNGAISSLNLYDGGPGTDPLVKELQTQLATLQKMPQAPQMDADLKQIYAIAEKYK